MSGSVAQHQRSARDRIRARVPSSRPGVPPGAAVASASRAREERQTGPREIQRDRPTGRHMVISLWQTEAAMEASEPAAEKLRQRQLTAGERVAELDRYEVAMLELKAGATTTACAAC